MSINSNKKSYNFYLLEDNDYGQKVISEAAAGSIEITINLNTQTVKEGIEYTYAEYTGLTLENIDDNYIIDFNGIKLKVLYVNSFGRKKIVFLSRFN